MCSLGPLVKKIRDSQIEVVINTLCVNMFAESERLRDISSVGACRHMARAIHC